MKIVYLSNEIYADIPMHDVVVINYDKINKDGFKETISAINDFSPDIIIEREFNDGKSIYYDLLRFFPNVCKVFWGIDTHVREKHHMQYSQYFDYIFLSISAYAMKFDKLLNKPVRWLPLYFPHKPLDVKKDPEIILSFVGNYKQHFFKRRREYLELLKPYNIQVFEREYNRMPEIMNNSLISFNCALSVDLNFRVFEALGFGSILLTDYVDDIFKINALREKIFVYKNEKELLATLDMLLSLFLLGEPYIRNIEDQQWIIKNHCLKHRIESIIEMINNNKQLEF